MSASAGSSPAHNTDTVRPRTRKVIILSSSAGRRSVKADAAQLVGGTALVPIGELPLAIGDQLDGPLRRCRDIARNLQNRDAAGTRGHGNLGRSRQLLRH